MLTSTEQRKEKRLEYLWPVWFAQDFNEILEQGQMVNISSKGAAFTCYANRNSLKPGQKITTLFSVPHYNLDDSYDMPGFTRSSHICRVENVNRYTHFIAVQFAEPLPFKPGEQ
jgi:hypothetical protein